ncbi:hypothetical protein BCR32DRAFT_287926 [Anaeromyces robustus]|uniref:Uncharacterized protein n=1 Tax=Anaeromyces robustus TaxID=1754192 RepID=A0A1Y1VPK6_9FUNG|nr:hypothetical protein BCR32DRAFT_287926 [Anaeromyces robustus]|eukprot:ORX63242.1 hypothetical protein BCR32DRAFT_287926 [Anaeromyces robustus]
MKSNNNKNINKNNKNNNNNHINNDNSNNSNPNNKLTISKGIKKKETILCTYFHLNNNKFSLLKILDDKSIPYEKTFIFSNIKISFTKCRVVRINPEGGSKIYVGKFQYFTEDSLENFILCKGIEFNC